MAAKVGVKAKVPSNIALVKYWGKSDSQLQWPANDSLSMTLSEAYTETYACLFDHCDHRMILNNQEVQRVEHPKVFSHLDFLMKQYGVDDSAKLYIESENSFPTGCGIASSASGFGALTLAAFGACAGYDELLDLLGTADGRQDLAQWSRLGSGSAGRSIFGGYVKWSRGLSADEQVIEQAYAADHWVLADTVALFSPEPKSTSSTLGHQSAWSSPLFPVRLKGLPQRMAKLEAALRDRDIELLGDVIEADALEMHSVMMSSTPALKYFGTEVGQFLALIRDIRQNRKHSCYFTIDAGPNVHVLSTIEDAAGVRQILKEHYPGMDLLEDKTGHGPEVSKWEAVLRDG